ncbi:MAG: hypothetical protein RL318_1077, partial [Fibrobacterota bacterium]
GKVVLRWWGSTTVSAGTEATKSVTITPDTVKASETLAAVLKTLDGSFKVGDTLKLGSDTLFYSTNEADDPRTMAIPSIATKSFVFKDTGAAQVAYRSVVGEHILWSELITVTVKAKDDTTTPPDTTKSDTSTAIRTLTAMPGNWTNAFDSTKSNWSLSVSHKTTSIRFKADLASSTAKLTINGISTQVDPDTTLTLSSKTNTFALAVTNGAAPRLCTLTVVRRDSVTAPAFDSLEGWYLDSLKVGFTNPKDSILYRTGTSPAWIHYTSQNPIAVTDSATIKAIAISQGDTSKEVTATFRIAREDTNTYGIPWNKKINYGKLIDVRDGNVYRTVVINGKTWMAQNLNYRATTGSKDTVGKCYLDWTDSCAKYGRLYEYDTALKVCPAEWHLPDTVEWASVRNGQDISTAGRWLKSSIGWNPANFSELGTFSANGIDSIGFRGLPSGMRTEAADHKSLVSKGSGTDAIWWNSTVAVDDGYANASELKAGKTYIDLGNNQYVAQSIFSVGTAPKSTFASVRCVKNTTP